MRCVNGRKNIKVHCWVATNVVTGNEMKKKKCLYKKTSSMNIKHDVYFLFKDLYKCGKCCSMFKIIIIKSRFI